MKLLKVHLDLRLPFLFGSIYDQNGKQVCFEYPVGINTCTTLIKTLRNEGFKSHPASMVNYLFGAPVNAVLWFDEAEKQQKLLS
jgi:hypothetical protein